MITTDVASARERPSDLTIRRIHRHFMKGGEISAPGPPSESVEYFKHDRKRVEHQGSTGYRLRRRGPIRFQLGPRIASITRCDLQQGIQLNLDDREYTAGTLPTYPSREELQARESAAPRPDPPREPTVLIEIETVDTGERQAMFGYAARHVITTRRTMPLGGSRQSSSTATTDSWYIDLHPYVSCDPWWHHEPRAGHAFLTSTVNGEPRDVPTFKNIGEAERGYMLRGTVTSVHTVTWPDGSVRELQSINEFEVTELSTAPIDPLLFEIPPGFRLVERIRQNPRPTLGIRLKGWYDPFVYGLRRRFDVRPRR